MSGQVMKENAELSVEEQRAATKREAERNRRLARNKLLAAFIVPGLIFSVIVALSYTEVINDTVSYLMVIPMLAVGAGAVAMVFQHFTHWDKYQDLNRKVQTH